MINFIWLVGMRAVVFFAEKYRFVPIRMKDDGIRPVNPILPEGEAGDRIGGCD